MATHWGAISLHLVCAPAALSGGGVLKVQSQKLAANFTSTPRRRGQNTSQRP